MLQVSQTEVFPQGDLERIWCLGIMGGEEKIQLEVA